MATEGFDALHHFFSENRPKAPQSECMLPNGAAKCKDMLFFEHFVIPPLDQAGDILSNIVDTEMAHVWFLSDNKPKDEDQEATVKFFNNNEPGKPSCDFTDCACPDTKQMLGGKLGKGSFNFTNRKGSLGKCGNNGSSLMKRVTESVQIQIVADVLGTVAEHGMNPAFKNMNGFIIDNANLKKHKRENRSVNDYVRAWIL